MFTSNSTFRLKYTFYPSSHTHPVNLQRSSRRTLLFPFLLHNKQCNMWGALNLKHVYIMYTLKHLHQYAGWLLPPWASIAFSAALVVPSHFSSLQHLGLFNKEASGSSEEQDGKIEWAFNSAWINPGFVVHHDKETLKKSMAYLKTPAWCSNSSFPNRT